MSSATKKNDDKFQFIMPAQFYKSDDGDWKIAGLASTEDVDQQGERIIQKGIDLTPVDQGKGWFNFDHLPGPENTIGTVDGYRRDPKGLYVHGRLFKNHTKAKAVKEIMDSLGDRDRGRIGLSVEGRILERDAVNKSVIKRCQISKVAITMNPVNQSTYADLVKSMADDAQVDFESKKGEVSEDSPNEAMFTADQVVQIVQKALGVGAGYTQAPADMSGGDALATSDMKAKKKKKDEPETEGAQEEYEPKKMKKMKKSEFQKSLVSILDKLQVLYPDCSRSELWEAVKDRLNTKFPGMQKGKPPFRLKQETAKEREHKLYEDARQRSDYDENKGKNRRQLSEIAREQGATASDRAKIRAQADARVQAEEDAEHVRPGVKG